MPGANPSGLSRGSKGVSPLDNYVVTTWRVLQTTHGRTSSPAPTLPALSRHLPLQGRLFLSENVSAFVLQAMAMHDGTSCPAPTPPALSRHLPLQGRLCLS